MKRQYVTGSVNASVNIPISRKDAATVIRVLRNSFKVARFKRGAKVEYYWEFKTMTFCIMSA